MRVVVAALELYLDPVPTQRVRNVWNALEAAGVPTLSDLTHGKHRPHISLTGAERLEAVATGRGPTMPGVCTRRCDP